MQPFDAPAIFNEIDCEPVEQLRMRRRTPRVSEVTERFHDPASEVMMPDTIDEDPRRERMVGLSQPAGERQPASARLALSVRRNGFGRRRDRLENLGESGLHRHAKSLRVATTMHVGHRGRTDIPKRLNDAVCLLLCRQGRSAFGDRFEGRPLLVREAHFDVRIGDRQRFRELLRKILLHLASLLRLDFHGIPNIAANRFGDRRQT